MAAVFLKQVTLNNYKSIKTCKVTLGPLTFLIGRNGAGKSNFMDALRLVSDSLNSSLEHALRDRGGINEVRRRSSGHPTHFSIQLDWVLPDGSSGEFSFRVGAKRERGFEVQHETCRVITGILGEEHYYEVSSGVLTSSSFQTGPATSDDRLYLVAASGIQGFRPIYDALSHMGFYNLNPEQMKDLQPPDPGEVLSRDGRNIASILGTMDKNNPEARKRVVRLLSDIVPGIVDVSTRYVARKETLEFRQKVGSNASPWKFVAENMSDGTLRALGILVALFQSSGAPIRVPLVGVEEPEVALHPGASGVLRDAIRAASHETQILVTSHSPDLLDDKEIGSHNLLVVSNVDGQTIIGPLRKVETEAIRDRLYTAGELLRMVELEPETPLDAASARQESLF